MKSLHKIYDEFDLKLFYTLRDYLFFGLFLGVILTFSLTLKYITFYNITQYNYYNTTAQVIKAYPKNSYQVLKIKLDEGIVGYTIYRGEENLSNSTISLVLNTTQIDFLDLFRPNYINSFKIKKLFINDNKILKYIQNQHTDTKLKEFFGAIFLASNISPDLRIDIQKLGISHLIAISGFHLGIISALLFTIFFYLYLLIYKRYFAYRNIYIDSMIFVVVGLSCYLIFLGFIPSLLRSFVMLLFGFGLFLRNIIIVSFQTLGIVLLVLLAFFPFLVFSLGFWFSFAGVFYIFLFLQYFKFKSKLLTLCLLNMWIYILMMPIVHYVFITFSSLEFFSPLFSLAFNIFYPVEIVLHLFGFGDLLDSYISYFLGFSSSYYELDISLFFLMSYIVVSFLSIWQRVFLYPLFIFVIFIFV